MPRLGNVLIVGPVTCEIREVDLDNFEHLNEAVNGSISSMSLPQDLRDLGLHAFCDDDGRARQADRPNKYAVHLGHAELFGPIVLFRSSEDGEEQALTDGDIFWLTGYLSSAPPPEAAAAAQGERDWFARTGGMEIRSFDNMDDFIRAMTGERYE